MAWDRSFDRPIELPNGETAVTLREAAEYAMILPKAEREATAWQHAMEILIEAAEGRNPIMFAQIAVNRALDAGSEPKYGPGKAVGPGMKFHRRRRLAKDQ